MTDTGSSSKGKEKMSLEATQEEVLPSKLDLLNWLEQLLAEGSSSEEGKGEGEQV